MTRSADDRDPPPSPDAPALAPPHEARLRRLMDALGQCVWAFRPDGTCYYANRFWVEYTGMAIPPEGLHARVLAGPIHPEERETALALWRETVARGEPSEIDVRLRRARDGVYRWQRVRGTPEHDAAGNVVGWLVIATDVDDGKRAETLAEELRLSEERLRLALDSAELGTWDYDPVAKVSRWDARAQAVFGLAAQTVVPFETFLARIHPDDRDATRARVQRALDPATGGAYESEYRLVPEHGGEERWALSRGHALFDAAGRAVRMLGTVRDVTEQHHARERQRFLSEAVETLSSSLDYELTLAAVARLSVAHLGDWCLVQMQDAQGDVRLLAAAHADPQLAADAMEYLTRVPADGAARPGVTRVLQSGEPLFLPDAPDGVIEPVFPDAEQREHLRLSHLRSMMVVPLVIAGRPRGALTFLSAESGRRFAPRDLATAQDLSRRASLAIENAQLYEQARDASRLKDEFLSTVSHELRTPLTAILGWTHVLRQGRPESFTRAVDTIERNARAQARIVDDMLDVSRIITGRMRLELRPVDLSTVTRAAVDAALPSAEAKGIALTVTMDDSSHLVTGDSDRLQQVSWNLLSNAIKFTPAGGRVAVTLKTAGPDVALEVHDTGEGIPRDFLPHVFERFRQADASPTRAHGGLGLGLAIVRHLVELHGGTVTAQSEGPSRGATFTVLLPARRSAAP